MKKIAKALAIISLVSSSSLFADCCPQRSCCAPEPACCEPVCCDPNPCCTPTPEYPWLIGAHVSAFRPDEERLRDIYGDTWANFQFYFGYSFLCPLDLIATVNYTEKTGDTLGCGDHTKIQIIPVGLEVRYNFFNYCDWGFYLGGGPRYYHVKVKNDTEYLKRSVSKDGFGGTVNLGVKWTPLCNFYIDLFVGYTYQEIKHPSFSGEIEGLSTKLGGLDFGGGIGWRF